MRRLGFAKWFGKLLRRLEPRSDMAWFLYEKDPLATALGMEWRWARQKKWGHRHWGAAAVSPADNNV